MTKEIYYDLHFTSAEAIAISSRGREFLGISGASKVSKHQMQVLYRAALDAGLHARFENARVRDSVAAA